MLTTVRFIPCVLALLSVTGGQAAEADVAKAAQVLLQEHCVKCHGPEKQKGGLRLDLRDAAFKGGESDKRGIVPGHADQSRAFQLVTTTKDDERMPPKGERLNATQIRLLQQWMDAGAEWPKSGEVAATTARAEMRVTDADRQHWSFLPLKQVTPPTVKAWQWAQTPVDQFIRRAQEEKRLAPAAPADTRTLVRRIYIDLIGLPPTPEEMQRWTARIGAVRDGVAELVDTLLTSPHYGERWARHWLDVARYADSNGMEADYDRPNAYHFRDFVIRALNDDMPYDQFTRWQLAGDELAPDNKEAIAATGFIVAGVNELLPDKLMEEERLRNRANELDDMVSTTAQGMLGLTLACARCHDHKYDPLPTRDYYRLMRIFNSGDRTEVPLATQAQVQASRAAMAKWQPAYYAAVKKRDSWLGDVKEFLVDKVRHTKIAALSASKGEKRLLRKQPDDPNARALAHRFEKELKEADADYVAALPPKAKTHWDELDGRVQAIAKHKPATLPTTFAFADFSPTPPDSWFFERGNFLARNEKMDLGFLTVMLKNKTADDYWQTARASKLRDDSTQQRRALAEWMTDLDHGAGTLLARVMVNRVWQHHFGEGLVRTVSDFGTRGELPTHPELLEWLTDEFIRSAWSLKHLHRLIMNSATYQQGSTFDAGKTTADPDNRLLTRQRPQRLESEVLRDTMLATAGALNPAMYGPSFKPPIPAEAMQARNVKDPYPRDATESDETRRRTIYMFHKRVVQYPLMQAFDAPDAQQSCGRRMNTTVAPQALALLNDPFVRQRAEELARRLQSSAGVDVDAQIRLAFQLCLNREPSRDELADGRAFIAAQSVARTERTRTDAQHLALTDFCQSLFGLNEFIYID